MQCNLHHRAYQYICKNGGCDLPLLCSQCRKSHLMSSKNDQSVHSSWILPLRLAYEQAQRNLSTNLKSLRDMTTPFQNEQQIFDKVQAQKRLLLQQRDQIIRKITQVFNKEIADLQGMNKQPMAQNKHLIPFQQIKMKIIKLQQIQSQFKNDPNKLREALSHSESNYLNQLSRNNSTLSSMKIQVNQYFTYDDIKHDFFLSRLQLKKRTLNNKLLQKIYNQSDLYFLIDDYKQGKYLHYFSPTQNLLRIYDIQASRWKQIKFESGAIPNYGATLYDYKSGRFYLVGGEIGQKKCNSIIWFSPSQGWKSVAMSRARSSAMVTALYDKSGNTFILIAGGVGQDRKHMKFCEIFYPKFNVCVPASPMNFAVTSGALVTFNDSIAFRIGGLGQFKQNMASICQISQKCDFSKYLQALTAEGELMQPTGNEINNLKWTYMDIQVVNSEIMRKFNLFYAHQAAIQINPNQIFVFGGMTHNSMGVNETYILEVESIKNQFNLQSFRYYARWINHKPLISAEGFINLRPIVYNKKVMSLQNISSGQNQYYQKQKRLIEFNMYDWRQIQNIVYN